MDSSSLCSKRRKTRRAPRYRECTHTFIQQVVDQLNLPIQGTEFSVQADVIQTGSLVTLSFPCLNFQVGQVSEDDILLAPPVPGYVITTKSFLPKKFRPQNFSLPSVVAPSGDGMVPISGSALAIPVPPPGYLASIDTSGALMIQQAGAPGNALSIGSHVILPFTLSYVVRPKKQLVSQNVVLDSRFTNLSLLTNANAISANIRDTHINDAFDGVLAWAYTANPDAASTANNILNLYVVMGRITRNGKLKRRKPVQITNFSSSLSTPTAIAWDTSIAINRTNKNNIVVSYGFITTTLASVNCRAVSMDGGKTWGGVYDGITTLPLNGPIAFQGVNGFGDIPGVRADDMGNFWFCSTEYGALYTNNPLVLLSSDGGVSFSSSPVYEVPLPSLTITGQISGPLSDTLINVTSADLLSVDNYIVSDSLGVISPGTAIVSVQGEGSSASVTLSAQTTYPGSDQPVDTVVLTNVGLYDYPKITFGGDGCGCGKASQYGLWMWTDVYINYPNDFPWDEYICLTFIPITGLGTYGTPQTQYLPTLPSIICLSSIVANRAGQFWSVGVNDADGVTGVNTLNSALTMLYKSPGAFDSNYAGPFMAGTLSGISFVYEDGNPVYYPFTSVPGSGYLPVVNANGLVYDERLKALYLLYSLRQPALGQDCRIFFAISRNNGLSWSRVYDVATTDERNRGLTSMAQDPKTGHIAIGWYDGRNDPQGLKIQYFGAVVKFEKLKRLVDSIVLTNPVYLIPAQGSESLFGFE